MGLSVDSRTARTLEPVRAFEGGREETSFSRFFNFVGPFQPSMWAGILCIVWSGVAIAVPTPPELPIY